MALPDPDDPGPGHRRRRALHGALALWLIVAIAPGCSFWADPDPPDFERMEVRGEAKTDDEGALEGDLHADTTLKGALIGGGSGAVTLGGAGVAASFVVCSPSALFYPACVVLGIVVLGGGGLIIGFVGGSVVGGIGGLPLETAEQVNDVLVRLQETRDLPAELGVAMSEALPEAKQIEPGADEAGTLRPDAIVIARLDEVKLRQHSSERLSLRLWASLDIRWELEAEEPKTRTCKYEYTTPIADVEDWLLDDGAAFQDAFTDAVRIFATWMARDLDAFATRTAQDETDELPETCFQD
jgi:hypothetical protein